MKLPAGAQGGVVLDPRDGDMLGHLREFKGALEIETAKGKGFILMRNGELVAACFEDKDQMYRGNAAVRYIMASPGGGNGEDRQQFIMRSYSDQDYAEALDLCTGHSLFIGIAPPVRESASPGLGNTEPSRPVSRIVDKATLNRVMAQPGVIAVSAFYEGFPVFSLGDADFEHVAARAEDLLRAGTRIALDMSLGQPDQLILETGENKFIIVPFGDLCLCIITRADAQLGLIRVMLRSLRHDVETASP